MNLIEFTGSLYAGLLSEGRYCKRLAYGSLLNSLSGFQDISSLPLEAVFSPAFLHGYEAYLNHMGRRRNTISFYMGTLRSLYGLAVEAGLVALSYGLFDGVFTGIEVTDKRAVAPDTIARIITADLSGVPRLEACRDYFLLSLQLQGMSFTDLAHLRKTDLQGDMIRYYRRKTDAIVQVAVLPGARAIFDKYARQAADSPYLLPLLTLEGEEGYREYQSVLHRQNRQLKELAAYLGIQENLTTYVARHTWATLAYHNGVDVGVVSQGMGHQTEEITRTYLASFSQNRLTEANYIVLNAILRPILEGRIKDVRPEMMAQVIQQAQAATGYLSKNKNENPGRRITGLSVGKGGGRGRGVTAHGQGKVW